MKNTKVIRSSNATREVIQGVVETRQALEECRFIEALQAKLGHNNSLLESAMAKRCEKLSIVVNGSTKYNVKMGMN